MAVVLRQMKSIKGTTAKQAVDFSRLTGKPVLDLYKRLHVSPGASEETIRSAYFSLAKAYHPDLNPRSAHAETAFKAVNAAAKILLNPELRALYDQGTLDGNGNLIRAPLKPWPIWLVPVGSAVSLAFAVIFVGFCYSDRDKNELVSRSVLPDFTRDSAPVAAGHAVEHPLAFATSKPLVIDVRAVSIAISLDQIPADAALQIIKAAPKPAIETPTVQIETSLLRDDAVIAGPGVRHRLHRKSNSKNSLSSRLAAAREGLGPRAAKPVRVAELDRDVTLEGWPGTCEHYKITLACRQDKAWCGC